MSGAPTTFDGHKHLPSFRLGQALAGSGVISRFLAALPADCAAILENRLTAKVNAPSPVAAVSLSNMFVRNLRTQVRSNPMNIFMQVSVHVIPSKNSIVLLGCLQAVGHSSQSL